MAGARGILVAGFTIVFALWVAWGFQLTRTLDQTETAVAVAQEAQATAERTLQTVRTNVLLGSIYLRDAIIDTAAPRREEYRSELRRLRAEVDAAMRAYRPDVASPAEREHWLRLQRELEEFWASRDLPFTDGPNSPAAAAAMLRRRVVPRRNTILQVIDQLTALQNAASRRRQDEVAALHRDVRLRLLSMGAFTMAVAVLVAAAAAFRVSRLQRQVERQRADEFRYREDLERLSARLVHAQEQERRRLARELHDEVGQALTAVRMDIGIALRTTREPRVKAALEEASDLAETTLRGVRDLSQFLHPSVLDDFGLPVALTNYLRSFARRTGVLAHLAGTVEERLAPQTEVAIYRIVQEALNNVARHSDATTCTVTLSSQNGTLELIIDDNGRGLTSTPEQSARAGLGLIGMRERAQALGGTFTVANRAGGSTRVQVTLPLVLQPVSAAEPSVMHT
jgi:signal transduction histidine kinase